FTPDGGTIRVHTSRSPDRNWILHVVDTGIGMTREELDRAFDAFTQGEHAAGEGATRYGGVGLGLAISKTLVELQKGEISAASGGRGQGCTLRIQLPLVETLETAAAPEHSAPSPPTAPELPQTPALRRVLLVE